MKKTCLFIVMGLITFPVTYAQSGTGGLTVIKNAKKKTKPQRVIIDLTLRKKNVDLNLGRVEVDPAVIFVSATGESQALVIVCDGYVRGGKTNALVFTRLVYAVPANDHIIMPNIFNPKSFKMRVEFLDHSGNTYYIGRELQFNIQ